MAEQKKLSKNQIKKLEKKKRIENYLLEEIKRNENSFRKDILEFIKNFNINNPPEKRVKIHLTTDADDVLNLVKKYSIEPNHFYMESGYYKNSLPDPNTLKAAIVHSAKNNCFINTTFIGAGGFVLILPIDKNI
jgi:hypothetical protein